jgi:mannose PTS system EIIA component
MTQSNVQLIVASHGDLACSLVRTVEMIAGKQSDIMCFALSPSADVGEFKDRIAAAVDTGRPTLVLVDMPGGTPWNAASAAAVDHELVHIVSGVNLPMLLEVVLVRADADIWKLTRLAVESGSQGIRMTDGRRGV